MRDLPFVPFFTGDWLASSARVDMTLPERAVYLDLLFQLWERGGAIPSDLAKLAKMAMATPAEFESAWPGVSKYFVPHPDHADMLTNEKMLAVIQKQASVHEARTRNGRNGGIASGQSRSKPGSKREAKTKHLETESESEPETKPETEKTSCPSGDGRVSDFSLDSFTEGKNPKKLPSGKKGTDEQRQWFDDFWKAYWRHEAKKPALAAFIKAVTTPAMFEKVMAATDSQREKMLPREPQYRPLAATWLTAERFADEVTEAKQDPLLMAARKFDERKNQ
jgi:uncharacterized protein YdaU (DUF1376 family)